MQGSYTGAQAARIIGVNYSVLDLWAREGLVTPSTPAAGTGSRRGYSFQDLVALQLAALLREARMPRTALTAFVRRVQERGGLASSAQAQRMKDVLLVTDGERVREVLRGEPFAIGGAARFVALYAVPLRPVVLAVSAKLRA